MSLGQFFCSKKTHEGAANTLAEVSTSTKKSQAPALQETEAEVIAKKTKRFFKPEWQDKFK